MPAGTRKVPVNTPGHHYDILIGSGLLHDAAAWQGLPKAQRTVIVSDARVFDLHGAALVASLQPHFRHVSTVLLPDGEIGRAHV